MVLLTSSNKFAHDVSRKTTILQFFSSPKWGKSMVDYCPWKFLITFTILIKSSILPLLNLVLKYTKLTECSIRSSALYTPVDMTSNGCKLHSLFIINLKDPGCYLLFLVIHDSSSSIGIPYLFSNFFLATSFGPKVSNSLSDFPPGWGTHYVWVYGDGRHGRAYWRYSVKGSTFQTFFVHIIHDACT